MIASPYTTRPVASVTGRAATISGILFGVCAAIVRISGGGWQKGEVVKTQDLRLIDVFVLGPFMIWAGTQLKNDWAKTAMIAAGAATMAYNWQNYDHYEKGGYVPHLHTAACPTGYTTQAECR